MEKKGSFLSNMFCGYKIYKTFKKKKKNDYIYLKFQDMFKNNEDCSARKGDNGIPFQAPFR